MSEIKVVKRNIYTNTSSKEMDEYLKKRNQEELQKVMDTITDIYNVHYEHYPKPLQKSIRRCVGQKARQIKSRSR